MTEAELASEALVRLGADPIDALDETSPEAALAARLYPPIRDTLTAAFPWRFAMKQAALAPAEEPPAADYAHAFLLPADFLRALSAGPAGRGAGARFRIAGQRVEAAAAALTLTYLARRPAAEGPAHFNAALTARLAAALCLPLTENATRAALLRRKAEDAFAEARRVDSQQDSPRAFAHFPLIAARLR